MNQTWKWAVSAVIILALVIGGYSLYTFLSPAQPMQPTHQEHQAKPHGDAHDAHGGGHGGGHQQPTGESDARAAVTYENGQFTISVTDRAGKPVQEFAVNHEKLNHMIVVSEDLGQYYHLHPEYKGNGVFTQSFSLAEGVYKAFVDVKPKDMEYAVTPIAIQVGQAHAHDLKPLVPETRFTKTIDGYKVTMNPSSLQSGQPVTLAFTVHDAAPEPYLGALGHVVILDEKADKYVHVHPLSETETRFETQFSHPGLYKIWAEFQLKGKVVIYPFVVEVK
jgi:ribosomal protein S9